jgi:hypothetical protein
VTPPTHVRIAVDARTLPAGVIREIAAIASDFPGAVPVYIDTVTSLGMKILELGVRVDPVPGFFERLRQLLGDVVTPARASTWERVAYIDETYSSRTYWVCGLVIENSEIRCAQAALDAVATEAAVAWRLDAVPELHGHELFHRKGAFAQVPIEGCIDTYRRAIEAISSHNLKILVRGVSHSEIRYQDPHRLAWRYAIESIDELPGFGGTLIVADEHHTERLLRDDMESYLTVGTGGWKPRRISRVLTSPVFSASAENRLLQAVDLVAFLHQRRFNVPFESNSVAQFERERIWTSVASHVALYRLWEPPASSRAA